MLRHIRARFDIEFLYKYEKLVNTYSCIENLGQEKFCEMKAWFWIWAGIMFGSLSQPVRLLHNWPGAGNAMAGISTVCQEDWLETLEEYYKEETEEEEETEDESGRETEEPETKNPEPAAERETGSEKAAAAESAPAEEVLPENGGESVETEGASEKNVLMEEPEDPAPEAEAAVVPSNRWGIQLSKEEMDLLACIVWVEARGEPDEGQRAVAEVVFNRMLHGSFPSTLYEVVSERSGGYLQFTSWKYVNSAAPTEKEYRNIQAVLDGQTAYTNNNTVYFSTSPQTRNITCVIGGHYFCE